MDIEKLTNQICFKEIFDYFEMESKLQKTDTSYWSVFTTFFKSNFNTKFFNTKIHFEKFENELYLNSFFKTYFKDFDFSRYNKSSKVFSSFDIKLNKFIKENFESLHDDTSNFFQLLKIIDIPDAYYQIYEKFIFKKYFTSKKNLKDCSYEEWIDFWSNILMYQKLPKSLFLKYMPIFEDEKIKIALNSSKNYGYYFNILETMPIWYKKLKIFN